MSSHLTCILFVIASMIANAQVIKFQSVGSGGTTNGVASTTAIRHSMSIGGAVSSQGTGQANHSGFFWGAIDFRPATQASSISFSAVSEFQLTLNFLNGNGSRRMVVAKANSPVDATLIDGTGYTASADFGMGSQIGTGNYVVYNGGILDNPSITVKNLSLSTTLYHFRVFEYNGLHKSNVSNIVYQPAEATLNPLPSPPIKASLGASFTNVTSTKLTINWTKGSGGNRTVIARAESPVNAQLVSGQALTPDTVFGSGSALNVDNYVIFNGTGNNITLTGLQPNTAYHFKIVEYNGAEPSNTYALNSLVTEKLTLTNPPVASEATSIDQHSFRANWSSVTGSTTYYLDVSSDNFLSTVTGFKNTPIIGTSAIVTGLTPGITYQYRVRASNVSGQSANSILISVLTSPPTPTAAGATIVTPTSFKANWSAANTATLYELEVATDNLFSSILTSFNPLTVNTTSADITGLSPNTTYYYRVRSVNNSGESVESNTVSQLTYPSEPLAVDASNVTQTGFTANWTPVNGISDYYIDVSSDDFSDSLDNYSNRLVSATSLQVGELTPGTIYKYRVRSSNATGSSINSNVLSVLLIPSNPVALAAESITTASFIAKWQTVTSATQYFIDVSSNNFNTLLSGYSNENIGTSTSILVSGLSPGTTYEYRVRAGNATGISDFSDTIAQITVPAKPDAVNVSLLTITKNSFVANWSGVLGATGYYIDVINTITNVHVSGYNGEEVITNFINVGGLTPATSYLIQVRAFNTGGISEKSDDFFVGTKDQDDKEVKPPTISLSVKNSLTSVSATITNGYLPNTVIFYHKKIAGSSFTAEPEITFENGTLDIPVDASWFDELGMEYYFKAIDQIKQTTESIHEYVFQPVSIQSIPNLKPGGALKDYIIFSVPFVINELNNNIEDIFDPVLGKYDKTRWRLVRYQGGRNVDYTEGLNKIEIGKGYWFNAKESAVINVGEGKLVEANDNNPFEMDLEQGWNQIGNPYPFNIDFSDVLDDSLNALIAANVDRDMVVWDGSRSNFKPLNLLEPWKGGFVFSKEAVTLKIPVRLKNSAGGRKQSNGISARKLDEQEWFVPLTLQQGESENNYVGFGMHGEASLSKDRYDMGVIPRFVKYLDMYTFHKDHFYPWFTRDVIPTTLNHTWNFIVESNFEEKNVELIWDNTAFGNNSAVLILYDPHVSALIDMKTADHYKFEINNRRDFKIFYSIDEHSFRPDIDGLGEAYPNPFHHSINFPFLVSRDNTTVGIQIYDLTGKIVHELGGDAFAPGYHELEWDGTYRGGDRISGGFYIYGLVINGKSTGLKLRLIKN